MTDEEIKLNMAAGEYIGYPVRIFGLFCDLEQWQNLVEFIEKAKINIYYCPNSDDWQCDNELTKDTVNYASENPDRNTAIIDCIKHLLSNGGNDE